MSASKTPAPNPCGSCPYRKDVPSGVWDRSEYAKLPQYDGAMHEQTSAMVFMCHQQDGKLCAGWVGCHDMSDSLAIRLAAAMGHLSGPDVEAVLDYKTSVPLFESGAAAATHGMKAIRRPGRKARSVITNLIVKGRVKA